MSGWSDEVQAGVDTEINLVDTLWLLLLQHVGFMLVVQELNNWHPRVAVVDIVSESWGINNGKADYGDVSSAPVKCVVCHSHP